MFFGWAILTRPKISILEVMSYAAGTTADVYYTHAQVWWRPHKQRRSKKEYGTLRRLLDFPSILYWGILFFNFCTVLHWYLWHNITIAIGSDRLWTLDWICWFFCELFIVFQRVVLLNKHRYMHLALHQEPSLSQNSVIYYNDQGGKTWGRIFQRIFLRN